MTLLFFTTNGYSININDVTKMTLYFFYIVISNNFYLYLNNNLK